MIRDGMVLGMPEEEYHSGPEISASALKVLADKTPRHYQLYRQGKLKKDTDAMKFGTAGHCALLEPEMYIEKYHRGPYCRRGTKEWKAAEISSGGKKLLKPEEFDNLLNIKEMVSDSCDDAKKMLAMPFKSEVSFFWTDQSTGLRCRCRTDWLMMTDKNNIIGEVKIVNDASDEAFGRKVIDLNWHIAAAHYISGVQIVTGRPTLYVFLPIESSTMLANPQEFEDIDLAESIIDYEQLMRKIAELEESGVYPGYRNQIGKVVMPIWWRKKKGI